MPAEHIDTAYKLARHCPPDRTVLVLDGVHEVQALIDAYEAAMERWSDPDADYEAIGAEQIDVDRLMCYDVAHE